MYHKLLLVAFTLCTIGIIAFLGNSLLMARRRYLVEYKTKRHRKRRQGESPHEETKQQAPFFMFWWLKQYALSITIVFGSYLLVSLGWYLVGPLLFPGSRTNSQAAKLPALSEQEKKLWRSYIEMSMTAEKNPQDAELHLKLARAQRTLGLEQKALASYHKVVYLKPDSVDAQYELGLQALALGDTNLPAAQVTVLNRRWPGRPESLLLQSAIDTREGRHAQAQARLRVALTMDPDNLNIRSLLITSLLKQRAFADAARLAEDAVKQVQSLQTGSVNSAQSLSSSGGPNAATEFSLLLAQCQIALKRYADAETTLRTTARADLSSPAPLILLGSLLSQRGEYSAALAVYEDALKRAPDNDQLMNNIADLSAEYGFDLERAAILAARMYARHPRSPAVADTLGWVLYHQRKLDQALPLLHFAATELPGNPTARYHFGAALLKNGQTEAGRRELETALKLSREFKGAARVRELLGRQG